MIFGGLFCFDDYGDLWVFNCVLWDCFECVEWGGGGYDVLGIYLVMVDLCDSWYVIVGVLCGGVWQIVDGGVIWCVMVEGMEVDYMLFEWCGELNMQDLYCVVQCVVNLDVLWIQYYCVIFCLIDGGEYWWCIEVELLSFGFVVVVYLYELDIVWFVLVVKDVCWILVNGWFVVMCMCDGGCSFESLLNGLLVVLVYDFVYWYGFVVDDFGRCFVMVLMMGGLWMFVDGGEYW